jgi:hypothetical protein
MYRAIFSVRSLKTIRFISIFTFLAITIALTVRLTTVNSQDFDAKPAIEAAASKQSIDASDLPHNLVAAFYDLENYPGARLLLNNKGLNPIELRPTLYSLDGGAFETATVTVEPNSFRFVSINDLASAGGESFRKGSIKLFHTGKDLIIGSQVYLEKESESLSFEERFAELGKFDSRRLEAIWFMPRAQTQGTIILSNTSDEAISVSARLNRKGETQSFPLAPHQTRVLDLRKDFNDGERIGSSDVVGISLEHNGAKSALKAHGQIKDAPIGYSNIITFSNPNTGKSNEWHGFGLHLGAMDGENLEPIVALKNVGASSSNVTVTVPYTRADDTTGTVNLAPLTIKAGEMRLLNMSSVIQRSRVEQIKIAGIEVSYDGAAGSVLTSVQSVSENRRQVFRVPMYDPFAQTSSTGGYPFRIDETSRTVFYIKNTTDLEREYIAYLVWSGGQYMIGIKKLAPHKTVEIDMKKLRDEQTPDERGNTIPLGINSGQIKWTIRGEQEFNPRVDAARRSEMIGRSEQIDTVKGISSSYACQNCCQKSAYANIYSFASDVEVGNLIQFYAEEQGSDCYGYWYYTQMNPLDVDWSSSNTDIATVDDYGVANIVGAGSVNIKGEWYATKTNTYGGWCPFPGFADGAAEVSKEETAGRPDCNAGCSSIFSKISDSGSLTSTPKVTDVTAQGATKISQVTGNQNFYHFVTPKDVANSQITLTAVLNVNNTQVNSQIDWEGATESGSNPLQATVPKSSAGKTVVKIKYGSKVLKEMRVWVVWSTITSPTSLPIEESSNGMFGNPPGIGRVIRGGYTFSHTIEPATIITDSDRPNLSGANTTPPPGGNHPIFTSQPLADGANKKWDVSRQMRLKVISTATIANGDFTDPPFVNVSYPNDPVLGNDDGRVLNENNDPYANNAVLTDADRPEYGIVDRAANNGDTYEARLHFIQFTRLEIEGTWTRISDDFLWRIHFKFLKTNGFWTNNGTDKALDNNGF